MKREEEAVTAAVIMVMMGQWTKGEEIALRGQRAGTPIAIDRCMFVHEGRVDVCELGSVCGVVGEATSAQATTQEMG